MTCQEFLARHAEYMDDRLTSPEAARWEAHVAACASCAHYDRVVRQGVRILRALPEVEPSTDFFPRLQHRLYNLEDELRAGARGPGASTMVSLAIAGVLALLAWSPLLRLDQVLLPVGEAGGAVIGGAVAADRTAAEPSSLRPVDPIADIWIEARLVAGEQGAGWIATEFLGAPGLELELAPATQWPTPAGEVWWWEGTNNQTERVIPFTPGAALAPRSHGRYSPLLTGARTARPAGAQLVRITGDTVSPYN